MPSCCCVWPRGLGVAVELGRMGALGMVTYDSRVFLGSSSGAAKCRDARARSRRHHERATLWRSLGVSGGKCAGRRLDSTTDEEGD